VFSTSSWKILILEFGSIQGLQHAALFIASDHVRSQSFGSMITIYEKVSLLLSQMLTSSAYQTQTIALAVSIILVACIAIYSSPKQDRVVEIRDRGYCAWYTDVRTFDPATLPVLQTQSLDHLGTVLVTGGCGCAGKNLIEYLLACGCKVRSFDISVFDLEHENLTIITGDLRDHTLLKQAVKGVDTIFHTAAVVCTEQSATISKENCDFVRAVNVESAKRLFYALKDNESTKGFPKRFILTSSDAVALRYGVPQVDWREDQGYVESCADLYTETKVEVEKFILQANGDGGVFTCAVRPSGIYGHYDNNYGRMIFESFTRGHLLFFQPMNPSSTMYITYAENLVHGQVLAACRLNVGDVAPGQAYFINDGERCNYFCWASSLVASFEYGWNMSQTSMPSWPIVAVLRVYQFMRRQMYKVISPPSTFQTPMLQPHNVQRVSGIHSFSIAKARKELGYEPVFNGRQALAKTSGYYKKLYLKEREKYPWLISCIPLASSHQWKRMIPRMLQSWPRTRTKKSRYMAISCPKIHVCSSLCSTARFLRVRTR